MSPLICVNSLEKKNLASAEPLWQRINHWRGKKISLACGLTKNFSDEEKQLYRNLPLWQKAAVLAAYVFSQGLSLLRINSITSLGRHFFRQSCQLFFYHQAKKEWSQRFPQLLPLAEKIERAAKAQLKGARKQKKVTKVKLKEGGELFYFPFFAKAPEAAKEGRRPYFPKPEGGVSCEKVIWQLPIILGKGTHKKARLAIDLTAWQPRALLSFSLKEEGHKDLALAEVEMLQRFQSPGIARLHSWSTFEGKKFAKVLMVQDLYPKTLGEAQDLDRRQLWHILGDCLEVLAHLHAHKIAHGDIKPPNILLQEKERWRAVLGDFSFASQEGKNEFPGGTAPFLCPFLLRAHFAGESIFLKMRQKSDLWGLSLSFVCLLEPPDKAKKFFSYVKGEDPYCQKSIDTDEAMEQLGLPAQVEESDPFDYLLWQMRRPQLQNRWNAQQALTYWRAKEAAVR